MISDFSPENSARCPVKFLTKHCNQVLYQKAKPLKKMILAIKSFYPKNANNHFAFLFVPFILNRNKKGYYVFGIFLYKRDPALTC